ALVLDITHTRESGLEGRPGVGCAFERPIRLRLHEQVELVAVPFIRDPGHEMRMAVDQTRQHGGSTEIDHLRASGSSLHNVICWPDCADAVANDGDRDIRQVGAGADVKESPDAYDDTSRGRVARYALRGRDRDRSERQDDGDHSGLPRANVDHTASLLGRRDCASLNARLTVHELA